MLVRIQLFLLFLGLLLGACGAPKDIPCGLIIASLIVALVYWLKSIYEFLTEN